MHFNMLLNSKIKALVVSRSRTVNPPPDEFLLHGAAILNIPNLEL